MRDLGFVVGTGVVPQRVAFRLGRDKWDDYGYRTTFELVLYDEAGRSTHLGRVKILQLEEGTTSPRVLEYTEPGKHFEALPEGFISLGQDEGYYSRLREQLGTKDALRALAALRDIAIQPELAVPFEKDTAFRNSLLRENGAQRAQALARALVQGESISESLSFAYNLRIEGAAAPIEVNVDFDATDALPGRLVAVIGANAAGKTRLLAQLGEDLAQVARASAETVEDRTHRFHGSRPHFSRVIALSFSPFDQFKRPTSDGAGSYVYCGARNKEGRVSNSFLSSMYEDNRKQVRELDREVAWRRFMGTVFGLPRGARFDEDAFEAMRLSKSSGPSSGQAILAQIITALVAWLSTNSIVLFDEPETHLHPTALARLTNGLCDVLEEFNSYAVVATHSPVVIQQVPAKRVVVFTRTDNLTVAAPLEMESLGESVSELTRHVFGTVEVDSSYRRVLAKLAESEPIDAALARFDRGLGMNARAYLAGRYAAAENRQS